jgi:hypothetical protein
MDEHEIIGQIGEGAFGRVMYARTAAGARARARGEAIRVERGDVGRRASWRDDDD